MNKENDISYWIPVLILHDNLKRHASVMFFQRKIFHQYRGYPPKAFLGKGVLKICSKFTGEHPSHPPNHPSVISIKLLVTLLKPHFGMGVLL